MNKSNATPTGMFYKTKSYEQLITEQIGKKQESAPQIMEG